MSYLLQDENGQVQEAHSISAGLDYPGVGPEHSYLKDIERAAYEAVTDEEALDGFDLLCRAEGIIPALEPAHALHYVSKLAPTLSSDQSILLCLSWPRRQGYSHRGRRPGRNALVREPLSPHLAFTRPQLFRG